MLFETRFFRTLLAFSALMFLCVNSAKADETIVFLRHGEKPETGLGQLSCQGLNRALALPTVLHRLFGKPDAVFAPDPSKQKDDDGKLYDYVRPLATIEPTAISFGLPVITKYGYEDINGLGKALLDSDYDGKTIFVAWEHKQIVKLVRRILADQGGDPKAVPKWEGDDFDSLYVLRLKDGKKADAAFEAKQEGLNGQSDSCPGAK